MSNHSVEPGHGDSPAAWTAVVIMLIGFSLGTAAFTLHLAWLVWVGVAVLALGPVIGWIMSKAGYGVNGPKFTPKPSNH